jgi:hypothetical protein
MALIQCRECGREVSSSAKFCPGCGIKKPKPINWNAWGIILALFFASLIYNTFKPTDAAKNTEGQSLTTKNSTPPTPPTSASSVNPPAQTPSAPEPKEKRPQWFYKTVEEEMGRGKVTTATIISENSLRFGFPYEGEQWPHLVLRSHPKFGKDILVNIDRGQFLCRYDDCHVYVRFDNEKPQRFNASGPSDHSSTTLFISDFSRFLKGVRKADKTYIEAEFYNNGQRVIEFDTAGLKWE